MVNSRYFSVFISTAIIANTVFQSCDQYPAPAYIMHLDKINSFFSAIFITEMFLKLTAFGFRSYFKDNFNAFDCVIVVFSCTDILISILNVQINVNGITAMRTFRILRIFKLAKSWKQLHELLVTLWKTLVDIASFTIVLFLFMFIYAILGMEMFAENAKFTATDKVDMINGSSL